MGDAGMQRYVSRVLLGERVDEKGHVHIHLRKEPDEQPFTITQRRLEEIAREVDAEFGIQEDQEMLPAQTTSAGERSISGR